MFCETGFLWVALEPASASQVLGVKACTTTAQLYKTIFKK